ncbi:MAG: OmpA family protein [Kofleriaceae bacterium]
MSIRAICAVGLMGCTGVATTIAVPLTAGTAQLTPSGSTRDELSPPWSLTASDGSGLALIRVEARAIVEGPLAYTELHLYFRNPEARTREGTFQITLPTRAAVSRFAMEDAGHWMEAEVVPKLLARRAYDDFLHRRQDPALLEKAAGNQFTAKVFPIAAGADKHLVIAYSEELPGMRYTLPLRGLPRAERVDVTLATAGTVQHLDERDWQPDRDFVATQPTTAAAVTAGTLVAAQVELAGTAGRDVPRELALLVDTSASRALGYAAYIASIRVLIGRIRDTWGDLPIAIVAFDQDTEVIFEGRISALRDAHVRALVDRGAAGASNLGQALAALAKRGLRGRVVVIGDGVITAGAEGRELQHQRFERIDYVLAGGLRDDRAAALVSTAGARPGAVLDLAGDPVAAALGEAVATNIVIDVPGATWVYPRTIASARAGTRAMVFARLAQPATSIVVTTGGTRQTIRALAGTAALVERAVAGAELTELEARLHTAEAAATPALRTAIADKSVAARVLSSETAMLVLESEADYARYKIDRKALAGVLVIGPSGLVRVARAPIGSLPPRSPTEPVTTPGDPLPRDATVDTDHDAIPDAADRCPDERESYNGRDDDDGCPDAGHVIMTETSIIVLQPVHFRSAGATIVPESFPILDMVATTLLGNPDITVIEIQGHTDELGDDAHNLALSQQRAEAVVQYLTSHGVQPARLRAQGYGETQPVDQGHTGAAWARNRRVDFVILERLVDDTPVTAVAPAKPLPPPPAITGELAAIRDALAVHDLDSALAKARDWHAKSPGDLLALVGLGEALEARHADTTAARVYGSIIDLFPGRADLRRFAGERLGRLANARELVVDTYRRAVADRPDHLTGHRLLAYAQLRAGRPADAFAAILVALDQDHRQDSYRGAERVLGEDAAMLGAVYAAAVPAKRTAITAALAKHRLAPATQASTRFVVYWETDANDVDFHIEDARGGHADYTKPKLASGGELYADVTTGYGPECFGIAGAPQAGPYRLSLHYFSQGPMGFGMGLLQIQTFDPVRGISLEDRPFIIMRDHARVDLGSYL